ncbi:GNAT family N-acetyltransferase [Halorussus halophilus]|uniref:GNAT family N-acetyltransferase n=1 Tax=Halorussus halophilus TaxID=2650975 RepID=UPI0013011A6C|nr:GNAT family N-acetyltransferase [Halorussus halophilus]
MQIRRVRADESEVERYVSECWEPYHEDLSGAVAGHALVDANRRAVVEHHQQLLESPSSRLWVALDAASDSTTALSATDATFAGFVRTSVESSPQTFDWPDQLVIHDLWVRESYRGSKVVEELVARAIRQARENGCERLTLNVGIDNERAVTFFEKLGFETQGYRMDVSLEDVALERDENSLQSGNSLSDDDSSFHLRRLRVDEDVMHRFVEKCWMPFWQDLGEAVGEEHLSPDLDRNRLVENLLEEYDVPNRRCWVVLDEAEDPTKGLDEIDAVFAGWLNAGFEPTDRFLDAPERLFVGNLYLQPAYRGSGLANRVMARAVQYAREERCVELTLGVETDNERASAYYEKLGFEPRRQRMSVPLDSIEL